MRKLLKYFVFISVLLFLVLGGGLFLTSEKETIKSSEIKYEKIKTPKIVSPKKLIKKIEKVEPLNLNLPILGDNYLFDSKDENKNKVYINKLYNDKNVKVDEVIVEGKSYKFIGGNFNFEGLIDSLRDYEFSEIKLVDSVFLINNEWIETYIKGQFLITKDNGKIHVVSEKANVFSKIFDLEVSLNILGNKTKVEIKRGFISNDVVSSFQLSGKVEIENGVVVGEIIAPLANIKNIDFKNVKLSLNKKYSDLTLKVESDNDYNKFLADVQISSAKEEKYNNVKLDLKVSGKESIKANLRGKVPSNTLDINEIVESGSLKGHLKANIKDLEIKDILEKANVSLDGDLELSNNKIIVNTNKELKISGGLNKDIASYVPEYKHSSKNNISIKPLKNKMLKVQVKPNFNIDNAKVNVNNKFKGNFKKLQIKEGNVNLKFSNLDYKNNFDFIKLKDISGEITGNIKKSLNVNLNNIRSKYKLFNPFSMSLNIDNNSVSGNVKNKQLHMSIKGNNNKDNINLNISSSEGFKVSKSLFPKFKTRMKRLVSGQIKPNINLNINKKNMSYNGSADIEFKDISFEDEKHAVNSFNYQMKINKLFPLQMPEQTIKSAFISMKGINLFNNKVTFNIKNGILDILSGKAKMSTGKLSLEPTKNDLKEGEIKFYVKADKVPTQEVLDLAKLQYLKSTGVLSGQLPIIYNYKKAAYSINNGAMFSNEKGHFSFKHKSLDDVDIPSLSVEMTRGALENFFFDSFQLFIEKKDLSAAKVKSILKGYSPNFWGGDRSALNLDLSPIFERLFN
jgi:hypothetical protein